MSATDHQKHWIDALNESIDNNTFVKVSIGNCTANSEGISNIYIKKVLIKREWMLSFTYRYPTKDIVKNYSIIESISQILKIQQANAFKAYMLFTIEFDINFEYTNSDKTILKKKPATHTSLPEFKHDNLKIRPIAAIGKHYLTELRITDDAGNVYKATQDKYRQINHYIEILSSLLKELSARDITNIVDMGAGKGYLTFALYDYLTNVLKIKANVTGVEYRQELVDLCNQIAKNSAFDGLRFAQGSIQDYDSSGANVLIALHACDTATDDAIAQGIKGGTDLIVVAPCCHKQIRREIETHKHKNDLDYLTKHGIFLERQAEMVTDGIRALIMEHFGYSTRIFEFISDAHTPKNIMLVGVKNKKASQKDERSLEKIKAAKAYFGIQQHHLEGLMGI
jgi:SAM-dependent methyltransferase